MLSSPFAIHNIYRNSQISKNAQTFEAFKKEALKRKKAVKEKTASPKEFTDWLYQQSNIIINLSVY